MDEQERNSLFGLDTLRREVAYHDVHQCMVGVKMALQKLHNLGIREDELLLLFRKHALMLGLLSGDDEE